MNNSKYKKVISTVLALNVLITCGLNMQDKKNNIAFSINNHSEDNNSYSYLRIEKDSPSSKSNNKENTVVSLSQKFTIDSEDIDTFKDFISSISVEYPYEKYYTSKYDLKKYTPKISNNHIIENNVINEDKLYASVIKNNENYLKQHKSSNYSDTSKSFVKKVCSIVTKQLNYYLKHYKLDTDLLEEKLQNLSIFNFKSFAKGIYKQESDILAINENNCTTEIICHELDHLVQSASSNEIDQNKIESRNGYCYKKTYDGINPYNWTWFIESCAESMAISNNEEATVYTSELKMLEAMKLITFQVDKSLEKSLYFDDINTLYDYFGAYTESEKSEINKMYYIVTVINNHNPGSEGDNFYKKIKNATGKSLAYTDYESELIGYVAITESKVFYSNLISKLDNKEITLSDVFDIMCVFEMELSRQTWYQSKYSSLHNFLRTYSNIQKEYLNVLGKKLNISADNLCSMYNRYYTNLNVKNKKIKIDWLSLNINNYLNDILDSRAYDKTNETISSFYESISYSSNKRVSRS